MLHIARLLLSNQQGGTLGWLHISPQLPPENKVYGTIVIHTASVISSRINLLILLPLVNMMSNPAALAVSICN